jgi:TldD protein
VRDRGAGDELFDYARTAVEAALAAGASYADARVVIRRSERLTAQNGELESVTNGLDAGVGVRSLIGSSWGFAATSDLTDRAAGRAGAEATATAKASALVPGAGLALADVPVVEDRYVTPHRRTRSTSPSTRRSGSW